MKEHDIWGWSRHVTDGRVLSVAAVSDQNCDDLFMVVCRQVNGEDRYYLERLADDWGDNAPIEEAFFTDCGLTLRFPTPSAEVAGLEHLEGRELAVLADGSPVEGCVVTGGRITLPYAASIVQAGLPYVSALAPLPVESDLPSGSTLGRGRAYGKCVIRFYRSVGGQYGPSRDDLYDIPFLPERWGAAVQPCSEDRICVPCGGWKSANTLWLVQRRPLPFRILALLLEVSFA